ncbi:MAG: hypothetical protein E7039_06430 [Lentisphaerae bacterium]|nr:hypothetical protein [Lentisphaerota bacterium]
MFSKVLDCPECGHRFNYENEGTGFPEQITCPECRKSSNYADFSALTFCQQCRTKLKIPLDMIYDSDLACPSCGAVLNGASTFIGDSSASTLAYSNEADAFERRQKHKRMLQDGDIFDKYRIIRLLGKGGMAEVYLAEHLLLKQLCAVKLMRAESGSDSELAIKRFLREAKLSHQFNHPNIVKVFDVGSDFQTGFLFIAMEYVEGKTLHDIVKERVFTEDELCKVAVSMANALNALAEFHVVHRDIKPSNIMLTPDGVYKLMDLGIAKSDSNNHVAGDMTLTVEQSTIGTPNYVSPEQCRSAHTADLRSDIYSLGATLYHLACGKLPFSGTTAVETLLNVMQTEAVPLSDYRPDLSQKMLDLIELMMRKNPDERPQMPDAILAAMYSSQKSKFTLWLNNLSSSIKKRKKKSGKNGEAAKVFRWVVGIALLVVIASNVRHISGALNKIFNTQSGKNQTAVQAQKNILANYTRAGVFPDKYGEFSKHIEYDRTEKKYLFPKIRFTSVDKQNLILLYDFANMADSQEKGVVDLAKNKMDIVIPSGSMINDFTIALDFCSGKGGNTVLFNIGESLKVFIYKGRLTVIAGGKHCITSNIVVPDNVWANVTLIYENDKRKLSLLSGDRFAGSYLLPEKFSWNSFSLGDMSLFPFATADWLNGKIDTIKVYNCAREMSLPENKDKITRDHIVSGTRKKVADFVPEIELKQN